MIKANKTDTKKRMSRDLKYQRAKLMYQYRYIQKMTFERISRMFGMSKQRVNQITQEYKEGLKQRELKLDK